MLLEPSSSEHSLNRTYDRDREPTAIRCYRLRQTSSKRSHPRTLTSALSSTTTTVLYLLEKGRIEEALGQVAHLIPKSGSCQKKKSCLRCL